MGVSGAGSVIVSLAPPPSTFRAVAEAAGKRRRKSPFARTCRSTSSSQGALINSRLDHLLGFELIRQFVDGVEAGKIERLRQAAVYADHDGAELLLPENQLQRPVAPPEGHRAALDSSHRPLVIGVGC